MAEERRDLPLEELEVQMVHGQFGSLLINFNQVSNGHTQRQVSRLRFNVT